MLAQDAILVLWAALGAALMSAIVLNDLKHRVIPFWMCALMAALGILKQLIMNGIAAAIETLAAAAIVTLLAFAVRWLLIKLSGAQEAIGGGDCAAAGAVAGYLWIPATAQEPLISGLMAACITTVAFLGYALATRKYSRGDLVPYGPFFYVWAIIGTWTTAYMATTSIF